MTTEPSSPRRRHILASINHAEPPLPSAKGPEHHSPKEDVMTEEPSTIKTGEDAAPEYRERKSSKFRFKSKRRSHRSSRHRERGYSDDDKGTSRHTSTRRRDDAEDANDHETKDRESSHRDTHRDRRHRHHHRHKRRRERSRSRSPTPPNPYGPPPLSPETAFRESLFDAMADDEGADYWEGVYGQPIHVYSNQKAGSQGELEQMDDEEYAAYVRQKMWEKTHQGLLEERARQEEQKKQKDEKEKEARRLTKEMEESLRRGEERRKRKSWKVKWDEYTQAWSDWNGTVEAMSWPVLDGSPSSINSENVRDFFIKGLDPLEIGEKEFLARLKDERVRWHPDKMQQKLGAQFDGTVNRNVTAVFQIIDKLWSDTRPK
ncbi:hypothetical protein PFICI_07532 [Pestalotiopsis fici W106-1]|uniref:J domain-containing protein n=1 Tax=Pestalotiopsis fici (strain W106-1 / CGMCC3.15140) TaxID=1229662 RepID=W3X1J3_PESFW|nr:uncharacterized protein PFICI_07532 [Pestalotiopsis fici W106-1]ETS80003.1 hypothetical protein PFICI_07532 [Pestalotiopsis fici W106-1]